jgi:hypothetical protein
MKNKKAGERETGKLNQNLRRYKKSINNLSQ